MPNSWSRQSEPSSSQNRNESRREREEIRIMEEHSEHKKLLFSIISFIFMLFFTAVLTFLFIIIPINLLVTLAPIIGEIATKIVVLTFAGTIVFSFSFNIEGLTFTFSKPIYFLSEKIATKIINVEEKIAKGLFGIANIFASFINAILGIDTQIPSPPASPSPRGSNIYDIHDFDHPLLRQLPPHRPRPMIFREQPQSVSSQISQDIITDYFRRKEQYLIQNGLVNVTPSIERELISKFGTNYNIDNLNLPERFNCPISLSLMLDPVTSMCGEICDRKSLEKSYIASASRGRIKDPFTNLVINHIEISPPALDLRNEIINYLRRLDISSPRPNNH